MMPDDLSSPTLKADFLAWPMRNLRREWKVGARTWVNLHINLYQFVEGKYLCAHPRSLAAASTSAQSLLTQLCRRTFCCWQCHFPNSDGAHVTSLWSMLDRFVWHWYKGRRNEWTDAWDSVAIYLNLICGDLAFALLGVDLQTCPLPFSDDARRVLPESLPWRKGGHNPRTFGRPWFLKNEDAYEPHPPAGSPPAHLKGSAT